jgi:large subunit ribosomal protein L1
MPNPKTGTVSENIAAMVKEIAGGRVSFKNDDSANVHQIIGKTSFDAAQLLENAKAFLAAVNASKTAAVKGQLVASVSINATMGPGIRTKF